jgi:ferredoxin-NADP reductase
VSMNKLDVVVTDVVTVNSLIKRFHFARADGQPLPAFSGGAHVVVEMQDGDTLRRTPYSLMSSPLDTSDYQISIRRDDEGRGGSLFMHKHVEAGMTMRLGYPANLFSLDKRSPKQLMFAGGIGITPFLAQSQQLIATNGDFELHYSARNAELAAYGPELTQSIGHRLHMYYDDQEQRIDFDGLLSSQPAGTHLYVCGPAPMIEHVLKRSVALGWPASHVHYEHFSKAPPGEMFTVELQASNKTVEVGKNQSLLEAIEAAGVDAPYLCRGGACGQCETDVVECDGTLLHEDHWLEDDERASSKKIMPCVSRFKGQRLVLDR